MAKYKIDFTIDNEAQIKGEEPHNNNTEIEIVIADSPEEAESLFLDYLKEQIDRYGTIDCECRIDEKEKTLTNFVDGVPVERYSIVHTRK